MKSFKDFVLDEMKTNNEDHGYHGQVKGSLDQRDAGYKKTFDLVKSITKEKDDKKNS